MGQPLILPKWKFFDANGLPLAGGKLYSYAAGTTTPQATYTDTTEGTPNTNPLILDANGEGVIWLGSLNYKFILKDSSDNVLWTADGIQSIPNGSITTVKLADGAVTTVKIADSAVTTAKILDANVTTAKIADASITTVKILDGAVTFAKLSASTEFLFVDTSGPRDGDGPTAYPRKPWTLPAVIAAPDSPAIGDGNGVAWSPNGKVLVVAENNSEGLAMFQRLGSELVRMSPGAVLNFTVAASCAAFSPDAEYLIVAGPTGGFYFMQRSGYSYAELLQPTGMAVGGFNGADWCPNGYYFASANNTSPYVNVVKRTDTNKNHIVALYSSNAGQSTSASTNTTVNYEDLEEDNVSSVQTGSGWIFTCKRANTFRVEARASFSGNTVSRATVFMTALKGITFRIIDRVIETAVGVLIPPVGGSTTYKMVPGEVLSIMVNQDQIVGGTLDSDPNHNWVSIIEDGGFDKLSTWATLSNPGTLPTGAARCVKWSPDGKFLAVGHSNIHYSFIVAVSNATIGATYTNNGVTFTVSATISGATLLTATGANAPTASGTLTKASGTGDTTIAFSAIADPVFLTIYQRTGDTFAKCADPAILPTGQVNGLSWSPDGLKLTCVHAVTPFITTYSRPDTSSATFTKLTNPASLPAGTGNGCAYNSVGDKLAVAHDTTPFISIYSVSGNTFTKDTAPVDLPSSTGKSVSWTPDCQYLAVGHVNSPYLTVYRTAGAYGTNAVTYVKEVDLV